MITALLSLLPAAAVVPTSDLTIALSVLVPFSCLLVLAIIVYVPVVIFKRRRKVDTIQDYASTAIELLTRGNPIQLPPQLPPRFPPHLSQQFPQHDPPLSAHDNTSVISEKSSVEAIQDYASTTIELTRGNPLQLPPQPPLHPLQVNWALQPTSSDQHGCEGADWQCHAGREASQRWPASVTAVPHRDGTQPQAQTKM